MHTCLKDFLQSATRMLVCGAVLVAMTGCALGGASDPRPRGDAAAPSQAIQPSTGPEYQIGPEDVLEISVWQEEDLLREVLVRPDGGISFPLAGDLQVAGRTATEVQEELTRRIHAYIPDALVTVSVVKVSGYQIYVLGKVNNPGQFTVGRYVDVIQALTLAGGLTPFAAESRISVIRRTADGERVYPFDYSAVKRGRGLDQNVLLQSGDVVLVP
ncbi:polysaccharide export outer membrane protein [Natronocella acetinitrilica]|uniref:Polysaccharide export outer membrane protein n=1 Tax=Natronocella acetinitrilica TaxID=414046 RepID=A0AAE3G4S0_9GAMM|nr:polysaccharide biosynthesis/export family protein [Natronocella acetinitrilica]MCP1675811.1 polysaccharide export outer membrane protein [Natronocella acetinitrilica]